VGTSSLSKKPGTEKRVILFKTGDLNDEGGLPGPGKDEVECRSATGCGRGSVGRDGARPMGGGKGKLLRESGTK